MITLGNQIEASEEVKPPPLPPEEKDHWWEFVDWTGAVAFTLSIGISCSMIFGMSAAMIGAVFWARPISEQGAALLSTIFGAAIGALATFLGQTRERQLAEQNKKQLEGQSK